MQGAMSLPAVLYVKDLRVVLAGWDGDRIRRFLKRNGLARFEAAPDGEQPRVFTTVAVLQERMPDALAAMEIVWERAHQPTIDPTDFSDLDVDE